MIAANLMGALLALSAASDDVASANELEVSHVQTSTSQVEDIAVLGETLWAATRGGVEAFDLGSGACTAHCTTMDGLDSNDVREVEITDGIVRVRTSTARCRLVSGRFSCEPRPWTGDGLAVAPRFEGSRVTARARSGHRSFVATATNGV